MSSSFRGSFYQGSLAVIILFVSYFRYFPGCLAQAGTVRANRIQKLTRRSRWPRNGNRTRNFLGTTLLLSNVRLRLVPLPTPTVRTPLRRLRTPRHKILPTFLTVAVADGFLGVAHFVSRILFLFSISTRGRISPHAVQKITTLPFWSVAGWKLCGLWCSISFSQVMFPPFRST